MSSRRFRRDPSYRLHKQSKRAILTRADGFGGRKDFYLVHTARQRVKPRIGRVRGERHGCPAKPPLGRLRSRACRGALEGRRDGAATAGDRHEAWRGDHNVRHRPRVQRWPVLNAQIGAAFCEVLCTLERGLRDGSLCQHHGQWCQLQAGTRRTSRARIDTPGHVPPGPYDAAP